MGRGAGLAWGQTFHPVGSQATRQQIDITSCVLAHPPKDQQESCHRNLHFTMDRLAMWAVSISFKPSTPDLCLPPDDFECSEV